MICLLWGQFMSPQLSLRGVLVATSILSDEFILLTLRREVSAQSIDKEDNPRSLLVGAREDKMVDRCQRSKQLDKALFVSDVANLASEVWIIHIASHSLDLIFRG